MDWFTQLNEQVFQGLDPLTSLLNLILVVFCGHVLSWHYLRFSRSLGNKRKFARLFLFLAGTTMMVISIVKTSLALSLGLVGALSIIRFRTPVKEPEDLAYIFLALATGIGFGADQRVATLIMFTGVLLAMTLQKGNRDNHLPQLYLHVNTPLETENGASVSTEEGLNTLMGITREACSRVDLRRVDSERGEINATLILDLDNTLQISAVIGKIQDAFPLASVSVIEGGSFD